MTVPTGDKHIGQYKILRTLGAGGMGTVYLGEHVLLGRRAAIKTLLPSLSTYRELVDRFFNEARAISSISDPGVVSVFDFGYHVDGTAYIVMEFLEGESLADRLDRLERLRLVDALRLARQLSSSLAAAHERGIVHRDLKPGNVFLVRDPEVTGGERTKILDFGICKLDDPDGPTTTQTGAMLGTPVYMSPEQCRGAGGVDHRSDIYALGCVLFHMTTGRPPFDVEGVGDYIAAHLKEPPPIPSSIVPELPPAVDALLLQCLAKDPELRLSSMTEVQEAIDHVLAKLSDTGAGAQAVPKPMTPLGAGFQSSFDVNFAGRLSTLDQSPSTRSHPWFVNSLLPVSLPDEYEVPRRRSSWGKRFALLGALVIGVAGGLVGTSYWIDHEAAMQSVAPPHAPAIDATEHVDPEVAVTAQEPAPPAPLADEEEGEDTGSEADSAEDKHADDSDARERHAAAKRRESRVTRDRSSSTRSTRAKVNSKRPRRVVREPAPSTPADLPEDLYDRR